MSVASIDAVLSLAWDEELTLRVWRRGELFVVTADQEPGLILAGRSLAQALGEVSGALDELRWARGIAP